MAHRWQKLCTEVELMSGKVHAQMTFTNGWDRSSMEPSPCLCSHSTLENWLQIFCICDHLPLMRTFTRVWLKLPYHAHVTADSDRPSFFAWSVCHEKTLHHQCAALHAWSMCLPWQNITSSMCCFACMVHVPWQNITSLMCCFACMVHVPWQNITSSMCCLLMFSMNHLPSGMVHVCLLLQCSYVFQELHIEMCTGWGKSNEERSEEGSEEWRGRKGARKDEVKYEWMNSPPQKFLGYHPVYGDKFLLNKAEPTPRCLNITASTS